MKVLVTGANGMLGSDLCPKFREEGFEVIATCSQNLDITDYEQVKTVLNNEKPDIVVHCAAYTNVDGAEKNLEKACLINVTGTENVAKTAGVIGAIFVYISTDYVFDGTKKEPYKPDDKPNPINNYGYTKLQGEKIVQKFCKKYYIARTSWLYGIHGKNFVETMILLSSKPEIKVVDDQIGSPTWTMELVDGVLNLLKNKKQYGIYHICGKNPVSWYGFTKEIFAQTGIMTPVKPCTTNEFPRDAKRPAYSHMDNAGMCRDWRLALKDYLKTRASCGENKN
ncbi:MAG: dTDP-4-dehydrorhamnose reductase [Candidatus Gastranaerophilales bacterium]|nr:dTDP-4-dehydrorhamnose reductase [Candidatus Gastranaerophilales bacterium]